MLPCPPARQASGCTDEVEGDAALVTRDQYREAMARLGAAVNVITTAGPGGQRGFTASAVCSVTDNPPTLLVCVNRRHESHAALLANRVMCINTLGAAQSDVSDVFAGAQGHEGLARFCTGKWDVLVTGAPSLSGAVVSFDCNIVQVVDVGTHSVLFGEVTALRHGDDHGGLIYFGRAYHPVRQVTVA